MFFSIPWASCFSNFLTGSSDTLGNLTPVAAARVLSMSRKLEAEFGSELSKQTKRELEGDLDTVVLKAIGERSIQAAIRRQEIWMKDLRRLQGKPILARPTTPIYG